MFRFARTSIDLINPAQVKVVMPGPVAERLAEKITLTATAASINKVYFVQKNSKTSSITSGLDQQVMEKFSLEDAHPAIVPGLDLEAVRSNFQRSEKKRNYNVIAQIPMTQQTMTLESKLAADINDAHLEDCMVAHPDGQALGNVRFVGLLTAIPLAVSAVSGKGCKW
ncbi:hypothetical protein QN372_19910 [Undibacterium sp. RTI2.1]|uniref:hypothetical protein n=1 Tax=unclassified Undibacterium TaxID=2630295 RepID=UPI002AB4A6A2|nr:MULTISPECIES: hypothetical protein [unclassified Undibacterium]MDY7539143.1 hypothetical protein [Undibacterium sp. 5I1]MEB0033017.1 hypothetical protein [Undibacterium sp. RTI2.1]MEB0118873.1 hypothetical protein [Undibacterium sp. RTI2.2]MEB0233077.1 hypothetical protein [Undibacterium sp. 10I3]MEB0259812.1 hypothetical protein [Undibacterium sp. 5I1]